MITLDTSALVRFFTNDLPEKALKVKTVLESKEKVIIPDVVFPELEYVLSGKSYNATRVKIAQAFEFLTTQKNVSTSEAVKQGVEIYKQTKLDMADCIIAATSHENPLLSFDIKLLSVQGVIKYKDKT